MAGDIGAFVFFLFVVIFGGASVIAGCYFTLKYTFGRWDLNAIQKIAVGVVTFVVVSTLWLFVGIGLLGYWITQRFQKPRVSTEESA